MVRKSCLLLVIMAWAGWVAGQTSYCSFTPHHTLCGEKTLGPNCGSKVYGRGVSDQDAAFIVAEYNKLRSKVAMGQERRGAPGPQPQAANMMQMEWDNELALLAQAHADQCTMAHECLACRRVPRFYVGQNLFRSRQSYFDPTIPLDLAIKSLYNEVEYFNPANIHPFQAVGSSSKAVGHYTQMMWWNSSKIGCGYTMYHEDGWWAKLITCNYGPAGNILNKEMYRRGSPCSACPSRTTCSLQYPGLCGPAISINIPLRSSADSDNSTIQSTTVPTTTSSPVNEDDYFIYDNSSLQINRHNSSFITYVL